MSLKKSKFESILYKYLYWIILLMFVLSMFLNIERILLNGIIILIIDIWLVRQNGFNFRINEVIHVMFTIYVMLSFVVYIFNGYPIFIMLSSFVGSFLPIYLVFCRKTELCEEHFENTYKALAVGFIISLILHFWTPPFYINYLYNKGYIYANSIFWAKYFFQGLFGVTALGTLSSCASLFFLCKFIDDKQFKSLLLMVLSVVTLFITGRRSAIAAFLLGFIFIVLFIGFKRNTKRTSKMFFLSITIVFIAIVFIVRNYNYTINTLNTVINVSGAVNERISNWIENIRSLQLVDLIFGNGFGTRSHTAIQYGYMAVTDSGYIQLLCELGIIGMILMFFMVINFVVNIRLNEVNYYYISAMLVVFVYLIQAIGSNVFEFQATAPLFWISMGYCMHYKRRIQIDSNCICEPGIKSTY